MSNMSQKDIDEKNAEHEKCEVEYALICEECQELYWTGVKDDEGRGFCSEDCLKFWHYIVEMEDYYKRDRKDEYLFDALDLNHWKKEQLIRNGETRRLL